MASIYNQVLLHWTDANNRTCFTTVTTQDQTAGGASAYTALASAAQSLSYASLDAIQLQSTLILASAATTGPYQSVLDRAVLLTKLEGLSGSVNISIPAPLDGIFLPGNVLVDMSNVNVQNFLTQLQATASDGNGHNVSYFKRGTRQRARGES